MCVRVRACVRTCCLVFVDKTTAQNKRCQHTRKHRIRPIPKSKITILHSINSTVNMKASFFMIRLYKKRQFKKKEKDE